MKKSILLLILFLSIALTVTHCKLHPHIKQVPMQTQMETVAKEVMQQSLAKTENHFSAQLKNLQQQNDELQTQLKTTQQQYVFSKTNYHILQNRLLILIKNKSGDTLQQLLDCDTLKQQTLYLLQQNNVKDSLCEQQTNELSAIVMNREMLIDADEKRSIELKLLLTNSMQAQDNLVQQNNSLSKTIRRKVVANHMLSASLLMISGAAAILFLHQTL
jgi:hypothetical protein